jgi:hypothetical protein
MLIEPHEDHFRHNAADEKWLAALNSRAWIGLTRDKSIQLSELAVTALMSSGSKLFVCVGTHSHEKLARNILHSRHKLDQFVRKHRYPFIARLYMAKPERFERGKGGEIKMWKTEAEWLRETRGT